MLLYGFCYAFSTLTLNMLLIECQPNNMKGFLGGLKVTARQWIRGIASLMIGLLWDWNFSYNWLWFVQSIMMAVAICLLITFFALVPICNST